MIQALGTAFMKALLYVKHHPQVLFILILLVVFPILFLYTGQQFLDVGRANQNTLQQQRIGLMHDVLSSLVSITAHDTARIQTEFTKLALQNPDLNDYKVLKVQGAEIVPLVARTSEVIGVPEENTDMYRSAAVRTDESLIFELYVGDERLWNGYRAIATDSGELFFIFTQFSLQSIDQLFAARQQGAYITLVFVYAFIIALALWHIRLTDYRYLYMSAQKANQTKDLFTNMIAHELRAPLTAIRGYANMLVEKIPDAQQQVYASRIEESSERLITLVNDLLDVARLQSGKLSVASETFDPTKTIRSVVDVLRISAEEKNISLHVELPEKIGLIIADEKRLHQAITNLVSNAIKYTQEGKIVLSLLDKPAYIELRVKDTGMGISAEDQQKLFAPFFRVSNESVAQITGTGLGMWITKELVELMGGRITVESIKGVGTHVVVSLPKSEIK